MVRRHPLSARPLPRSQRNGPTHPASGMVPSSVSLDGVRAELAIRPRPLP